MNTPTSVTAHFDDGLPVTGRTVPEMLRRATQLVPEQPAIIEATSDRRLSYRELERNASRVAGALRAIGIGRQDFVLVMLDEHLDNVVTWLGANIASICHIPINTSYRGEMLRYVIEHSGARVLIIEGVWCDRLAEVADGLTKLETVVVRRGADAQTPNRLGRIDFDKLFSGDPVDVEGPDVSDVSTVLCTSGTEGRAKGVLMPHGQMYQMASSHPRTSADIDVHLVTGPLFHAAALLGGVLQSILIRGTAVLHGSFSVSRFWRDVRKYHCTTTFLLGPMPAFLLREPPTAEDRDHTLKTATLVPAIKEVAEFADRFGVAVGTAYGSTETGPVLTAAPGSARPQLCGTPQPAYVAALVDELDVEVPCGEAGELVIRSLEPCALNRGYHAMPSETVAAWRNLWFHTGDVFRLDESGQYEFVDRRKDVLRRRGENVSSFEVERHLLELPHIEEAAVVAVPSETAEDEIKAVIVLAAGVTFDPAETLRQLYRRMPYFMVPRYFEVVGSLPKTATLRVLKAKLRSHWGVRPCLGLRGSRHAHHPTRAGRAALMWTGRHANEYGRNCDHGPHG